MTGQLDLGFDRTDAEADLAALVAAGEQPGPAARTRLYEVYAAATDHFGLDRRIVEDMPWTPWRVEHTSPGGGVTTAEQLAAYDGPCRPTLLKVFVDEPEFNTPWFRGACLACTWEGDPTRIENVAVEDAHDHALGTWWRVLPVVDRPGFGVSSARLRRWTAEVTDLYEEAVPGSTTHPGGCPVRTRREHSGAARHHFGGEATVFRGYDLGAVDEQDAS